AGVGRSIAQLQRACGCALHRLARGIVLDAPPGRQRGAQDGQHDRARLHGLISVTRRPVGSAGSSPSITRAVAPSVSEVSPKKPVISICATRLPGRVIGRPDWPLTTVSPGVSTWNRSPARRPWLGPPLT